MSVVAAPARTKTQNPKQLNSGTPSATQRLNFVMPDALVERLKIVRKDIGASTITEVLKNALRLYIAAVLAHKRGETLVFRSADGKERAIDVVAGIL